MDTQLLCDSSIPLVSHTAQRTYGKIIENHVIRSAGSFILKQTKQLCLLLPKAWCFLVRRASIVEGVLRGQNLTSVKGYRDTELWVT